ncbi:MAG: cell division protein FtsW [Clostridiales bacterium]|nr:cell division protein FtsW [Clostridiales bacterium]
MKRPSPDYTLFAIVFSLVLFGMLMVFSASYYNLQSAEEAGFTYFTKQAVGAGIGLLVMVILSFVDYHVFQRLRIPFILIVISIFLLILVLIIGEEINGAKRWLDLEILSFQPSEIARVAIMLFSVDFFSKRGKALRTDSIKQYISITAPVLIYLAIICGLIIAEPNLSMMISVLAVIFCIMIVSGTHPKPLFTMIATGIAAGAIFIASASYRIARLRIFLNPWKDSSDGGYQLIQSLYALGSGGLTGVGLGNSRQKHLYLTFGESDFILSVIGEELGYIGIIILMSIFAFLIYRGVKIAQRAPDTFGMLLSAGIISMIAIQVVIHVAVVTSSMPPTGVPLPFVSAGNTSLIMFMASIGVLLNISKSAKKT